MNLQTLPKSAACTSAKTLLIVGPLPPPMGGATLTVQALLAELAGYSSIQTALINTSPPPTYRKKSSLLGSETLQRAIFIAGQYLKQVKHSHTILVFANNSFTLTLVPLLLLLARWYKKSFYLKPIGGDLDLYLAAQKKPLRNYLLKILRSVDGILPQTQQLQTALAQFGCSNTYYVPGCRPTYQAPSVTHEESENLRLIFLSQIKREKGAMILLEALRLLAEEGETKQVVCDFYGPVFEDSREAFFQQLETTPGAKYCGVAEAGTALEMIAGYDALVLPTYFVSEGHPGVIIEAMQVGVPVISTQHRAIPELITHGENGFLVPPRDSLALAQAIRHLALDRSLRERMRQANYQRAQAFRADVVVPQILAAVFPNGHFSNNGSH